MSLYSNEKDTQFSIVSVLINHNNYFISSFIEKKMFQNNFLIFSHILFSFFGMVQFWCIDVQESDFKKSITLVIEYFECVSVYYFNVYRIQLEDLYAISGLVFCQNK